MSYKAIINFDFVSLYPRVQKSFSSSVRNVLRKYKIRRILSNKK